MAQPQTTSAFPVPVPVKGVNFRDSRDKMPLNTCEWMLNMNPEAQSLKVRPAYVEHAVVAGQIALSLVSYNNEELFCYVYNGDASSFNEVHDVTTSTPTVEYTAGTDASSSVKPNFFGGRVGFMAANTTVGPDESPYYNGSTWQDWATPDLEFGGFHKGRLYGGEDGDIEYGDVGAITFTAGTLAIDELFEEGTSVAFISTMSSPLNTPKEQYLAIASNAGEVLVFAGDFPDAPNWEIVAKIKGARIAEVGSTFGSNLSLQYNGDVYYITRNGLASVQRLMQYGADDLENTMISYPIQDYWTRLFAELPDFYIARASVAFWPEQNKIYVLVPGFLDVDGNYSDFQNASTMFVYNVISKGWGIHKVTTVDSTYGAFCLTYHDNNIYYCAGDRVVKVDVDAFADEDLSDGSTAAYDVQLYSAHTNFGDDRKRKKIIGFDAIVKTDFGTGKLGMEAASDFGRKKSDNTSYAAFQDGYSNPFFRTGISGNYLQYRWEGTSDTASTDGFELLSMGVAIE